jgi:sulfatase modifying factor 1
LPTESEWEYAAAGGSHNYAYPWGDAPVPDNALGSADQYAAYDCLGDGATSCTLADILASGSRPAGHGAFGQDDLAGSMDEWAFDADGTYPASPRANFANVSDGARIVRGGSWFTGGQFLTATYRLNSTATFRGHSNGFRCARTL